MGCGTNILKISYIIFNVILAIYAITAIALTTINAGNSPKNYDVSLFIICGLMVTFAVLGGFAAIRESICLTAACATFLFIVSVLQFVSNFYHIMKYKRIGAEIVERAWLDNSMQNTEIEYKCCGKLGAQDYVLINKPIPMSCYEDQQNAHPELLYLSGCNAKLQDYFNSTMSAFWIVNGFINAFEIIGFLLALFLFINLRNKQRRSQF